MFLASCYIGLFPKKSNVTYFSRTAHPKTVPNTETGKTYLLMTVNLLEGAQKPDLITRL